MVPPGNSIGVSGPGCEFFASVLAIGNSLEFCWDDVVRPFLPCSTSSPYVDDGEKANVGLQNAETCSPNLLPECNGPFGEFSNAWGIS